MSETEDPAEGGAAAPGTRPSEMEKTFPPWNEEAVVADINAATGEEGEGKWTDAEETALCPETMAPYVDEWKRPEEILKSQPEVPMVLLREMSAEGEEGGGGG